MGCWNNKEFIMTKTFFDKTCAISLHKPKTTALIFDKIISTFDKKMPIEIHPFVSSGGKLEYPMDIFPGENEFHQTKINNRTELIGAPSNKSLIHNLQNNSENICNKLKNIGYYPILCEPSFINKNEISINEIKKYAIACLSNINIIDESQLSWEQVLEIRKDNSSHVTLINFENWLTKDLIGKNKNYVEDKLNSLYENRNNTLIKFGIVTINTEQYDLTIRSDAQSTPLISETTENALVKYVPFMQPILTIEQLLTLTIIVSGIIIYNRYTMYIKPKILNFIANYNNFAISDIINKPKNKDWKIDNKDWKFTDDNDDWKFNDE